jgi:RNA polymerase sigma-70 factor (ECF subfamily)
MADWKALYERYLPMVLRRCRGMLKNEDDALDAAHDVFARAIGVRARADYPSSLLYTIATRLCLNRIRDKKSHGDGTSADSFNEEAFPFQDAGFAEAEARVVTEAILKTESEDMRTLLYLYYVDSMTLEETGKVMGLSVSGVRKRLLSFKKRASPHGG